MKRAAGVLGISLALAAPASAQAATLSLAPVKACYRTGDVLTLSGSGFTPGAPANIALDAMALGPVPSDPAGNFAVPLRLGTFRGVGTRTLTGTDAANPANVGTLQFLASAVSVRVRPRNGQAGSRVRIKATGFTTGKRLFVHVRRRGFRRDSFVGRLRGPCRKTSVRRRILPAFLAPGVYTVQFDTKRRFSSRTKVRARFRVTVTGGSRGAAASSPAWQPIG